MAKDECLRQHRRTGGRGNRIYDEDFNAALREHNVILEKEKSDGIEMLARAFIGKGVPPSNEPLESGESFEMKLPEDTAGRRVRLSLARKKMLVWLVTRTCYKVLKWCTLE